MLDKVPVAIENIEQERMEAVRVNKVIHVFYFAFLPSFVGFILAIFFTTHKSYDLKVKYIVTNKAVKNSGQKNLILFHPSNIFSDKKLVFSKPVDVYRVKTK